MSAFADEQSNPWIAPAIFLAADHCVYNIGHLTCVYEPNRSVISLCAALHDDESVRLRLSGPLRE